MNNLIRETIMPESEAAWLELRKQDLTSTESSALFGLNPYATQFEIWHQKKEGKGGDFSANDRMLWGNRLQDAIAQGVAEDQGLVIRPMREYMRIPALRLGSSFDYAIEDVLPSSPFYQTFIEHGPGLLEIKNVDWLAFKQKWVIEDNLIEAPPHIEIQTPHQQIVSGRRWSIIGALVGGNRYELIERIQDPAVHAGILARAAEFWRSIDNNLPPPPVMPNDAQAVIARNQFAEPGKLLDARKNPAILHIAAEYHKLGKEESSIKEQREVLKADLLSQIGDHEKVLLDGFTVSAGLVGEAEIPAYTRKAYRAVRVTKKTTKA